MPDTALPAYARVIDDRRGLLALLLMRRLLRGSVKRRVGVDMNLAHMRDKYARLDAKFGKLDPEATRSAVDEATFSAEWIALPHSRPDRVLLYFHGGAFLFRFPTLHAAMAARCCRPLAARALMVDYRLAPEHSFPAAPDDCHAAYRWLLAQGIDSRQIVIGGDSAGANLALVTLLRIKAAGEPLPACAVLLSPFTDLTLNSQSLIANEARDPMLTLAATVGLRAAYAPPERLLDTAVSPLFADFSGLPPLLFQVSNTEMLLDDSLRTAARAHACGVSVQLQIWSGMPHVFQAMRMLPQSGAAIEQLVRFIGAHTAWREA